MITYRGLGILDKVIDNLPIELHLKNFNFCGPGTKLKKRLARGDKDINPLDSACKEHDIAYSQKNYAIRGSADNTLADKALERVRARDSTIGEKIAALAVAGAMKIKSKFGLGMKLSKVIMAAKKNMKRGKNAKSVIKSAIDGAKEAVKKSGGRNNIKIPRVLPMSTKVGGVLPFLIPLFSALSAVGAVGGGTAGIVKAVNDAKAAKQRLHEMKKHNRKMETIALGKGLYLKPYKAGLGLSFGKKTKTKKQKKNFKVVLPNRALTNHELVKYVKLFKIPHFRGVFMRDELPSGGPRYRESAIVNLDDSIGRGTHWIAFKKNGSSVIYFDSFGDLHPPLDLVDYLSVPEIMYNHQRYQNYDTHWCGHLCLDFLRGAI
uniref:Phospholipase A2-like domain-containing protein n=1 Tax=Trichogramma kaykai TaxID=54128 RepID=A0ABD2W6M0_9HYME